MVSLQAKEAELTTFVARGELTKEELLDAYASLLNGEPSPLVLWDLTDATLARVRAGDMPLVAKAVAELARGRRPMGRSAFVCGRLVDFGLARMLTTYLSLSGYPTQLEAFMDGTRARAWLRGEDD